MAFFFFLLILLPAFCYDSQDRSVQKTGDTPIHVARTGRPGHPVRSRVPERGVRQDLQHRHQGLRAAAQRPARRVSDRKPVKRTKVIIFIIVKYIRGCNRRARIAEFFFFF